jgi:hypothetical protein
VAVAGVNLGRHLAAAQQRVGNLLGSAQQVDTMRPEEENKPAAPGLSAAPRRPSGNIVCRSEKGTRRMATSAEHELTETLVENFVATMKFIARNDLWEKGERALQAAGITTIRVSSEPIRVFRAMVTDDLLANDRLEGPAREHAQVIAECGCGVSMPGPGHGPVSPTGPVDAGTDATTLPPDGG